MIQNYLVFCINGNAKFVDGSIPSGKITANSVNKNSIFTISPFAQDTIIKGVFQPKDRAIEPMTVWSVPTDKVKPQDLINPNKSYYELVKDWYVREVKVPSLVLEYISSARNTEIGITFFVEQRIVPKVPSSLEFTGYLDEDTVSITNGTYKIVKPVEIEWNGLSLNFNDVVYNNGTYQKINAVVFRDNTSTILYGVDPAILNDNFESIDPTTTDLVLQKLGELEQNIELLDLDVIKDVNGVSTFTTDVSVGDSGNSRTISVDVKIDPIADNLLEANINGLLVDKNNVEVFVEDRMVTPTTPLNDAILEVVQSQINPIVDVEQENNKDVVLKKQDGQEVTLYFGFENIDDELARLEASKLDKNFQNLANQTLTNLTDSLVINRGGVAYKTTLADLLSHVQVTELYKVVTVLPEAGLPNTIYLLINPDGEEPNIYDEYLFIDNEWEKIGSGSGFDLSSYYTKTQVDTLLGGKVDKVVGATRDEAYSVNASGAQTMTHIAASPIANSLALRSTGGVVRGGTPVGDTDLTPKLYVDTQITNNKQLFIATFGTTTFAEITQALADGKLPIAISGTYYYTFVNTPAGTPSAYYFQGMWLGNNKHVYVNDSNVWANRDISLEPSSNKVQTISASSTTTQFPSAKATYDALQTKEALSNKTQVVNEGTPSEDKYPSELALVEYIGEILGDIETLLEAL